MPSVLLHMNVAMRRPADMTREVHAKPMKGTLAKVAASLLGLLPLANHHNSDISLAAESD
jgi:hypothetical protein